MARSAVREIGGARLHTFFERQIDGLHLVACEAQVLRVAVDRKGDHAHHQDDDHGGARRYPAQQRCIALLFCAAPRAVLVGDQDRVVEKDIDFIHQRLAAIALDQRQGLGVAPGAFQRNAGVHLGDLFGHRLR
jgi:hypothetical protein